MDKQSTLAFVLMGVVLVVWLYFNTPEPQPQTASAADTTLVTQQNEPEKVESENSDIKKERTKPETVVANSSDSTENMQTGLFRITDKPESVITIETDLYKIEMTSKGGKIRKCYLKKYQTWYYDKFDENDFYNTHVQLLNQTNGGDLDLIFVTRDGGKLVNTSKLDFTTTADNWYYKLSGSDSLKLSYTYKADNNKEIRKNFIFYGNDYQSKVEVEMVNMNDVITDNRYDIAWQSGLNFLELNSVDEATYANSAFYGGGELFIIDAESEDEKVEKDVHGKIDWVSIKSKYFAMILSPEAPTVDDGAKLEGTRVNIPSLGIREYYSVSLKIPFGKSNYQKDKFALYLGPVKYEILNAYNKNYEAIYDFGSFFGLKFVTRPISEYFLQPLFTFLHSFIPNYGIVIIIFSILIKILLSPLTKQSYLSMGKMAKLQPKIAEIKEKYKGDQQKIQKETMKLYQTYGINPAGGCLPMLLQMPILFALFAFFRVAIEIRHESFLWIKDLASPDFVFSLPFKIPIVNVDQISILAILLGITMFFQQKMTVKDPNQKAMVYMMPIMMTFMFMNFSSGLNLYYMMFNLLSIIQQYYINKKQSNIELVPVDRKNKKPGFMQKMMEAAEEQKKAQQRNNKKRK
jgi:YidC/Oxa1 family membrane protein insertase